MNRFSRPTLAAALLASVAVTAPSYAQDVQGETVDTRSDNDDTEIVVTAQKREENLQDVPISIQALGTRKLDQLNISNFNEFTQLLPSVAFQSTQPGSTTVYMRGVASGGDGNHSGSLPSVGFYLDEQPITTIGGTLDVHVYDIARIESLAGPQGTLYGASSQAGTIRIITNKPDAAAFEGRADAEVNSVEDGGIGYKLEGMVNVPLAESMALRVVGFYQKDAGYIDNVPGTRTFLPDPGGIVVDNAALVDDDFNEVETWGGRAALKIDLDDTWTATPTVLYQEQRQTGTFGFDPSVGDLDIQRFYPDYRNDRFVQAALTIEGKLGNWDLTYAGAYLDRKTASATDYTDYSEAYDSLYSSVGGLAGYFYYQDATGATIDPRQWVIGTDHFRKMSHELRVASPSEDRLRLTAGLFYQRQSNDIYQDYTVPNLGPQVSVNGSPGTLWLTKQERVDKDYAAFGEAAFDILPNLTLTAGGRAFIYDNSLIGFFGFGRNPGVDPLDGRPFSASPFNGAGSSRTGVAGCFLASGQTLREAFLAGDDTSQLLPGVIDGTPCTNLGQFTPNGVIPLDAQGQGFTHRINLTWKPTDDVLVYGTWSRGFRPGGINRRSDVPGYQPDYLTNYEFGWKTTILGGLRFNGAVFLQEWDKFQFSFLGENSFTIIQNGPSARIKGVEADLAYNIGGLALTASAAYTDAKTTKNLCAEVEAVIDYSCTTSVNGGANAITAPEGTRLPITPEFKANATARYTVPFNWGSAYGQGVVAYQSSASSDIRVDKAAAIGRLESYTLVNFAIGADFRSFTLEAFLQNAFDERAQLSRFQSCGVCDQRTYIVPSQPRTIGLRAGTKF